jgi:hypothetical protein
MEYWGKVKNRISLEGRQQTNNQISKMPPKTTRKSLPKRADGKIDKRYLTGDARKRSQSECESDCSEDLPRRADGEDRRYLKGDARKKRSNSGSESESDSGDLPRRKDGEIDRRYLKGDARKRSNSGSGSDSDSGDLPRRADGEIDRRYLKGDARKRSQKPCKKCKV